MDFCEALAAMKAGHPVRRESWIDGARLYYGVTGAFKCDAVSTDCSLTCQDIEATDWRRCDRMDADEADRVVSYACDLWEISQTIQNALDRPGQQVGCRVRISVDQVRTIVSPGSFTGLVIVSLQPIANGQTQMDLIWHGDSPRPVMRSAESKCVGGDGVDQFGERFESMAQREGQS